MEGESSLGFAFAIAGYLLGSVCFGILAAKRAGLDLAEVGSGNVGATNVARALGKRSGIWVLLLDALKGFLPTLGAVLAFGAESHWTAATGFAAVFGHCFPIWHRFRGGKGAATGAGVLLAAVPVAGASAAIGFLILKTGSGRASVGSLGGAGIAAVLTFVLHPTTIWPRALAAAVLLLVTVRHRDNIRRLIDGTEPSSRNRDTKPR